MSDGEGRSTVAFPHAPHRGRVARLLGAFHVTGVFWYRFHAFGARRPDWLIRWLIPLFTTLFFFTLVRIRRAVAANLEVVLGPSGFWERQRRIWRTFSTFAWCQTERYERLETDRAFAVEVEGREHWRQALEGERGCVLLTAHLGNWEMASGLAAAEEGRAVHVVREEEADPAAQRFIAQRLAGRLGEGYTTHFAAGTDPRLGLLLREALERGELVALQGDRPRSGSRRLPGTLFDRPYELPAGPLALARQSAVSLLPVFALRTGRRAYRVLLGEPIMVHQGAAAGELQRAAERFTAQLEMVIRRRPHQWFVWRELWP